MVFMNSPKGHAFDWVKALGDCSVNFEFEKIKSDVGSNTKRRNSDYPNDPDKWKFHEDAGIIHVSSGRQWVAFKIEYECIVVTGFKHNDQLRLTLTLDDDGDCLFKINGEGLYKRWQVIRRALEPLFFRLDDDIDSSA